MSEHDQGEAKLVGGAVVQATATVVLDTDRLVNYIWQLCREVDEAVNTTSQTDLPLPG